MNLKRITLDTNPEDCNLHCIMCEEHSPFSDFKQKLLETTGVKFRRMPTKMVENIFEQAKELGVSEIIASTMGEPLLYDGIDIICSLAKHYGIKIDITTNGTFPKRSVQKWAKLLVPIANEIRISWNGAIAETAEKIMNGISFRQTIRNVEQLVKFRNQYFERSGEYCKISFQITFMQNNMSELPEIVKLAATIGIDAVKGGHIWSCFPETDYLTIANSQENINKWNEFVYQSINAQNEYCKPNGDKVILEKITPITNDANIYIPENYDCPFLGKELWISAIGQISPCPAPDNLRNQLGNFGNIGTTKIKDVLASQSYKMLVSNYKHLKLCSKCVWRNPENNINL